MGVVAGEHGALAGGLDHHRDAAVQVGQQQHSRRAVAERGDTAGQPLGGHHRVALADAGLGTGPDQDRMDEDAAGIGDDAGRDHGGRRLCDHAGEIAELHVLLLELVGDDLPLAEPLVLPPKLGVFVPKADQLASGLDHVGDARRRLGHEGEDRCQRVRHGRAHALDQQQVGLAEDHQREGAEDQQRIDEAMGEPAKRERQPLGHAISRLAHPPPPPPPYDPSKRE